MSHDSRATEVEISRTERYVAPNYAPLPVVICKAAGCWAWDIDGNKYLDCISAYSSVNQGHCHKKILAALTTQAARLTLTSRAVHNDQMGAFLELLCELSEFENALPMNTGAEAVETAIKLARKWAYTKKGVAANQAEIIVCANNFHGRTTTISGFSSERQYWQDFGPATPGFVSIEFGNAAELAKAITPNTAALLLEPIQAEAGVLVPPPGYLSEVRKICTSNNVLLMLDEIQTGLGRTGRMFAFQHEQAQPDVLMLGKALGGGMYPVSAVLASREIMHSFAPGDHGSTFGGNPLASAVAMAAIQVLLDEDLVANAAAQGQRLQSAIERFDTPAIQAVRGKGLLIGIQIDRQFGTAKRFALQLLDAGVMCKDTHSQVLRIAPPLTITDAETQWLIDKLAAVFSLAEPDSAAPS